MLVGEWQGNLVSYKYFAAALILDVSFELAAVVIQTKVELAPLPRAGPIFKWVIDSFEKCLPSAEKCGVTLGLENHWGLGRTPEGVLRIVDAINSP